jgi:hypothetical protein
MVKIFTAIFGVFELTVMNNGGIVIRKNPDCHEKIREQMPCLTWRRYFNEH